MIATDIQKVSEGDPSMMYNDEAYSDSTSVFNNRDHTMCHFSILLGISNTYHYLIIYTFTFEHGDSK